MTKTAEALVTQFVDAFNSGDADTLGAVFHDEAEFVNIFGTRWSGREEITTGHAQAFAARLEGTHLTTRGIAQKALKRSAVRVVQLLWTLHHPLVAHSHDNLVSESDGVLTFVAVPESPEGWIFCSGANTVASTTPGQP